MKVLVAYASKYGSTRLESKPRFTGACKAIIKEPQGKAQSYFRNKLQGARCFQWICSARNAAPTCHPRQETCSRCAPTEVKIPSHPLRPPEFTLDIVLDSFPSHTLRPYQREILRAGVEAFQSGKKCVLVLAPTGFGKSYVDAAFGSVTESFYVTPQLALIDQLLADPNLKNRFVEIKGRQNYRCYYNPQRGVHVGKCETENYPCHERFDICPYWMQKQLALHARSVLMSLAYLIFEGTTEGSETYLGTPQSAGT